MIQDLVRRHPRLAGIVAPWPTAKSAVSGASCPSPTSPPTERDRIGMQEVATICGRKSKGWAIKQVHLGRLRAHRDGTKWFARRADLDAFLNSAEEV